MYNALVGMVMGGILSIIGFVLFICNVMSFSSRLYNRLPHNGQTLATACQLAEYQKKESNSEIIGYFYKGTDKIKVLAKEERKGEVKVSYKITNTSPLGYEWNSEWIPCKDFHPYYTTEELSEQVNKILKK